MQKAYIEALFALAQADASILSIAADNGTDYDWLFQRDLPEQFLNVGISEQNMVAVAAGLSTTGFIPFVTTAGAFMVYRAYEFIRDDICLGKRNVKMFASGSGMSISNLGPTHHTTEDVALLRTLPNLTVFSPATPSELKRAVNEAYRIAGPVYIRAGMSGERDDLVTFDRLDKACCVVEGREAALCVSGSIVHEAVQAAARLKASGINAGVYHFAQLMPFDAETVERLADEAKLIVTLEEHSRFGGLGGLVAEVLAERSKHAPLMRLGLEGFACGYGTQAEMRKQNHLSADDVFQAVWSKMGGKA